MVLPRGTFAVHTNSIPLGDFSFKLLAPVQEQRLVPREIIQKFFWDHKVRTSVFFPYAFFMKLGLTANLTLPVSSC